MMTWMMDIPYRYKDGEGIEKIGYTVIVDDMAGEDCIYGIEDPVHNCYSTFHRSGLHIEEFLPKKNNL
jgi:hypothetical protein